jgi:2-alkyl-3-oxoalkanoate reductase
MHVFIAGASGTIGTTLVPALLRAGHEVTGTTRSAAKADALRALGARPVVMDGLDAVSVRNALREAAPDAIVHQMTALAGADFTKPDKAFAMTNRLRTEGTDNLLAAAYGALVIGQSFASFLYERAGTGPKREDDPVDPAPPEGFRESHAALLHLERRILEHGGVVLRYGGFYGPGSGIRSGGEQAEGVRARKFPIVGSGAGVWSFLHTEDGADGTVLALERARRGEAYNIVDDEPAAVREWLPYLASILGAKAPRHVPAWLGRWVTSPATVAMMNDYRGASNAKARADLGWRPNRPNWRDGFQEALAAR